MLWFYGDNAKATPGDQSWEYHEVAWPSVDNPGEAAERHRGPIRNAELLIPGWGNLQSWQGRDSMAWWQDGSSNQLIVGETYYAPHEQYEHFHDSSWFYLNWRTRKGTYRGFRSQWPLARSGVWENTHECHHAGNRFGSWHPGLCNFLIGDGSVRSFSHTTPTEAILFPLAHVCDGASVPLP